MAIAFLRNNPNKPLPIGFVEKFSYGMGDFSSCMLYVAAQVFLMYYYTEYAGVNMAIVATIMLFSRIFDGISDIVMGHILDHTSSPYGKARSWILKMLIPYVLGATLLFAVPSSMSEVAKLIYIFFTYNFTMTFVYTAINLPYGAMSALMTQDANQRTVIVLYRMVLSSLGYMMTVNITMPLVKFFGNDARAWTYTFLVIGLCGAAIFFMTFYFCHERVDSPIVPKEQRSIKKSLKSLIGNRYWVMLTVAFFSLYTADVTFNTVNIYYCKYFLNNDALVGTFGTIGTFVRLFIMIAVLPFLLKPLGKRNLFILSIVLLLASISVRLVMPYNLYGFYVSSVLWGFGHGFSFAALWAMIPDTVEYGEYKDGERQEGFIYAGASFSTKVAGGIGPVIMGYILSFAGYVPNATEQTASASNGILLSSTIVPMAIFAVGIIAMIGYHLDKEFPSIVETLKARKAKKGEVTE